MVLTVALAAFAEESVEAVSPPAPSSRFAEVECRHGFGLAAGSYYGNVDWDEVGTRWGTTASPVYEALCFDGSDERSRSAFLGVMSAPSYLQFRVLDGEARHQWAAAVLGVTWGDRWSAGPVLVAGYAGLGAGLVARLADDRSVMDTKLVAYGPLRFGMQAVFTYGIVPRARK